MALSMVALAPGSLGHIANIVKGYALAVGVAFAMWMVWQWWRLRQAEVAAEKSARARAVYARHLGLALQHPELAEPMNGSQSSPIEVARYRTFVAGLLVAADEILALDPTEAWRDTLARQLVPHRSYLGTAEFLNVGLSDCSPPVRELISRVAGI